MFTIHFRSILYSIVGALYCGIAFADSPAVTLLSNQPDNIILGDKGRLEIKVDRSKPLAGLFGVLTVRDERGGLVSQTNVDLALDHSVIELVGAGYYAISLIEKKDSSGKGAELLASTTIGVLPDFPYNPAGMFGLWHVHGDPEAGLKAGAIWTRAMRTLKDYKLDGNGKVIPRPDRVVNPTVRDKYSRIDTLSFGLPSYLTGHASNDGALYPPKDWLAFERLMEQFARDFDDISPLFALYNEPEVHWKGTDQELVRFFDTMAIAIKRVRPSVKVLGPGFATIDAKRILKLVNFGLLDHLDGIATNAYVNGSKPEDEFIGRIRELKLMISAAGKGTLPIYLTEFGWTSSPGISWQKPVDELTQARYVARSLALLRAEDVSAAIYFCLRFNATREGEEGFSVTHKDGTPKPAYVAFSTAARMIGHTSGKPSLIESDDGMRLLQLRADAEAKSVLVIWSGDSGHSVLVPGKFSKSVVDMMGRSHDVSETIKVDESPHYFIAKALLEDIPILKNKRVVKRGTSVGISVPQNIFVPQPLNIVDKKQIVIPVDAPLGTYWLVSDANKRITIFPIVVTD